MSGLSDNPGTGSAVRTSGSLLNEVLSAVADGGVDTVIGPNLSRLSRDRKERLRLLLDVDSAGVAVHSVEFGHAVDLDDN